MKCVKVSDDISISAYVYRCRSESESQGLDLLPKQSSSSSKSNESDPNETDVRESSRWWTRQRQHSFQLKLKWQLFFPMFPLVNQCPVITLPSFPRSRLNQKTSQWWCLNWHTYIHNDVQKRARSTHSCLHSCLWNRNWITPTKSLHLLHYLPHTIHYNCFQINFLLFSRIIASSLTSSGFPLSLP